MRILAFDPGLCTGVCHLHVGNRIEAGVLADEVHAIWIAKSEGADLVVVEKPVIYPGGRGNARPNDLITLALRAGEIAGACAAPVRYVKPSEWKGQLPKEICHVRLIGMLTPSEKRQIEGVMHLPQTTRHNVLDAIGIAMWAAGRRVI